MKKKKSVFEIPHSFLHSGVAYMVLFERLFRELSERPRHTGRLIFSVQNTLTIQGKITLNAAEI